MSLTKAPQFTSLEQYLATDPSELPEGRFEYWEGELVPVMTESIGNINIANYLLFLLIQAGIPPQLLSTGQVEVVVPGTPKTCYPDVIVLADVHRSLLSKKATITRDMPPPQLLAEIVSPGNQTSGNYKRDYQEKALQYAAIAVPEYWVIDPDRTVILVGTLVNGAYDFQEFRGAMRLVSVTFPEIQLTAEQVLQLG